MICSRNRFEKAWWETVLGLFRMGLSQASERTYSGERNDEPVTIVYAS